MKKFKIKINKKNPINIFIKLIKNNYKKLELIIDKAL